VETWAIRVAILTGIVVLYLMTTSAGSTRAPTAIGASTRVSISPPGVTQVLTPPTPAQNGAAATRSARLDQLGQEIDRERPILQAQQTSLDGQAANIQALASQIQAIEAQYPGGTAPTSVVDQDNALVSSHNSLVRDYNTALASFKSDRDKFNSEVDEYNRLLQQR
jgi:hypothetical protein